jgi:hypothetical protein
MPAWGERLTATQINLLVEFVQNWAELDEETLQALESRPGSAVGPGMMGPGHGMMDHGGGMMGPRWRSEQP